MAGIVIVDWARLFYHYSSIMTPRKNRPINNWHNQGSWWLPPGLLLCANWAWQNTSQFDKCFISVWNNALKCFSHKTFLFCGKNVSNALYLYWLEMIWKYCLETLVRNNFDFNHATHWRVNGNFSTIDFIIQIKNFHWISYDQNGLISA